MPSKSEQGYSLIELIIGVGLILLIGSMIGRYLVSHRQSNQVLEAKNNSRQLLNNHLSRIRKSLETRDSAVPLTVQPTSISFEVPVTTMAKVNYTVTIQNRCRPLPAGASLTLRNSAYNQATKACFEKISCPNGIPYIEWTYTAHPTLTLQKEPSDQAFATEFKKAYGNAGYGVCFESSATGLTLVGALVNVENQGSSRTADLATEIVTLPILKRNAVEVIP
ncbi:MAG: hypothetical protein M3Q07_20285 [Pseudobdellovibrionaceae bacterium]|nr:hypothetical protein [Pseudobdellovibrionaceae bacterium]